MIWRNPEDKLQIEGVELSDEEKNGNAEDGDPSLKAGQWIPGKFYPSMRRKLTKESFDLSPKCGYLVQPPPVVGFHTEVSESVNTEDGSTSIANDDIQDPMIPPTFRKVWQLMLQTILQELKDNGDDCGQPPISKYQSFAPVSH